MTGDWPALIERSLGALSRGEHRQALDLLEPAVEAGTAPPAAWLLLAQARSRAGDPGGEERALDGALAADGRFVPALLAKGDLNLARGDERAASSFFNLALSNAPANPPPGLRARLDRARVAIEAVQRRMARHLDRQLADASTAGPELERFAEALTILKGGAEVQLQQPTSFFYPGLPQRAFYDPAEFEWAAGFEAQTDAIRGELDALLRTDAGFQPYVQGSANRANRGHSLLDDPRWSALYLWRDGAVVEENARRCPAAMAALATAPMPRIPSRAPGVLFSMLRPRTHIPPHWGMLNTRLICHLPLIVPEGCRLRVGNHERAVEAGKLMIFDDSINHEAWNDSDDIRIVLLFEIWNPALSEAERTALTAMFEAVSLYGDG